MEKVNEQELEFRHGDHGPKYLIRGPKWEGGIIVFKPGQTLGRHYHNEVEETFYFLEGSPKIIINDKDIRVKPGDVFRIDPGEAHNIVNDTPNDMRAVFIKCPCLPKDKVSG